MINKYCYKCGSQMNGAIKCPQCKATSIELPKSKKQASIDLKVEKLQAKHKPKKGAGCLIMLIAALVMFGLPATFMFFGDGLVSYAIGSLILLVINLILFKYRKNMIYEKKSNYFNLSEKSKTDFDKIENLCVNCDQLLLDDMNFCPECSRHTSEDIAISIQIENRELINKSDSYTSIADHASQDICNNCGEDTRGKKFCIKCGTKVEVR